MKTWHPTQAPTAQGFFPKFGPDGWLLHGAGQVWLSHPGQNVEHFVHAGWHVGWWEDRAIWWDEDGDGMRATSVPDFVTTRRADLDFLIESLGLTANGVLMHAQAGGALFGGWAAVLNADHRVFHQVQDITAAVLAQAPPGWAPWNVGLAGPFLFVLDNPMSAALVFEPAGRGFVHRVPIGGGYTAIGPRGELLTIAATQARCVHVDGTVTDETVVPWGGDGPGQLLDVAGVTWRWFWTGHDRLPDSGRMIGHPLGDKTCIILPAIMTFQDVQYGAGAFSLAGVTDKGYLTVLTEVPVDSPRELVPDLPPLPAPTVSVDFAPPRGRVPLVVTGTIRAMEHVETWRWCRNGQIDQPIDGLTHTYPALNEWGTYAHTLRAAGPGGRLETAPFAVEALPHEWRDAFGGLQAGFGGLLGDETMSYLRDFQFERVRVGLAPDASMTEATKTTLLQSFADEARAFGLEPLVMIAANEALCVPPWSDVEIYAPTVDYSHAGTEPDLRPDVTVDAFARAIADAMPTLRARHCRVWTGCVSNPSVNGRLFLSRLFGHPLMPADVHLTFHRYSPPRARDNVPAWAPFATRLAEIDGIKQIAGPTRRIAVTEWGYHTAPQPKFGGDIGAWLARVLPALFAFTFTDEQVADFYLDDWALYWAAGLTFVCPYQINDGATADAGGRFGIRRYPSEAQQWKPSARTVGRFARPARVVWGA